MADLTLFHRTINDTIQELQFQVKLYKFVNYHTDISELHPLYNEKISFEKYIENYDQKWSQSILSIIVDGIKCPLFGGLAWLSSCGRYACYNPQHYGVTYQGQWLLYDNLTANFLHPYFKTKNNDFEKDCWHDLDAISSKYSLIQCRGCECGYEPFDWYHYNVDEDFNIYLSPVNSDEFEVVDEIGSALKWGDGEMIESNKLIHQFIDLGGQHNTIFSSSILEFFQQNIEDIAVSEFFDEYPYDKPYDETGWIHRYRDFLELIKDLQISTLTHANNMNSETDEDLPF